MHSANKTKVFSGMSKAYFRRWVIYIVEMTIKYMSAMIVMSVGCVVTALAIGWFLNLLGVGYG